MQDHQLEEQEISAQASGMAINRHQIRGARAMLGLTVAQLARRARLGTATIRRAESDEGVTDGTRFVIQHALEDLGIVFIDENQASPGGGVGIRLKGQP